MTPEYRAVAVTIDGETAYPAVVALDPGGRQSMTDPSLGWRGDDIPRWNGWIAAPLFDRATVDQLMADWARDAADNPDNDMLAWSADTVILTRGAYAAEPDYAPERIEPESVDGVPRWCVGGCCYVWSVADRRRGSDGFATEEDDRR